MQNYSHVLETIKRFLVLKNANSILYYIIIIIVITTILLSWLAVVCYCAQALPPEKVLEVKIFRK